MFEKNLVCLEGVMFQGTGRSNLKRLTWHKVSLLAWLNGGWDVFTLIEIFRKIKNNFDNPSERVLKHLNWFKLFRLRSQSWWQSTWGLRNYFKTFAIRKQTRNKFYYSTERRQRRYLFTISRLFIAFECKWHSTLISV